jgi:hypothetical protein
VKRSELLDSIVQLIGATRNAKDRGGELTKEELLKIHVWITVRVRREERNALARRKSGRVFGSNR